MYWGDFILFYILTDYYGHAWPMCATSPQCENTFGMPLVHHRAELAFLRCFVTPCHIVKFYLHVLSHRHVLSRVIKRTEKFIRYTVCHFFPSNIVIRLSSSLDVCIGVRECTRALCCVVLLSPLQIMIKMNLFCILGRLQGHRCQLCQI